MKNYRLAVDENGEIVANELTEMLMQVIDDIRLVYPSVGFCYTKDTSDENINAIRDYGCLLALISLDPNNFEDAVRCKPDMCEFLHTSDFKTIEQNYLKKIKLY